MTSAPVSRRGCLNCGAELGGEYCAACGQKVIPPDITMREFVYDTTREVANWDGKIPQSLWTLFARPGFLTKDFLAGRRARWLPPLRLYLICSVAYFVSGPFAESITHRDARMIARVTFTNPDGTLATTLTPEQRAEVAEGLPARIFGAERIERAMQDPVKFSRSVKSAVPQAMFLLLPFFALLTSVAWRRKGLHYPAHLYNALHIHAAAFGTLALVALVAPFIQPVELSNALSLIVLAYVPLHVLIAFHRVFGDSWPGTVARSLLIAPFYFLSVSVVGFGILGLKLLQV